MDYGIENQVLLYCTGEAGSGEVREALRIGEDKDGEVQELLAVCKRAYDAMECDGGMTRQQSEAMYDTMRPYYLRLAALTADAAAERKRIGARIRELRTENGITQQQLADALDLDRGYVAKIESGAHSVGVDILAAVSRVFGKWLKIE